MRQKLRLAVLIVLIGLAIVGLDGMYAYDNYTVHPYITREATKIYQYTELNQYLEYIVKGSIDEDIPFWRSLKHFYNPYTGEGLKIWIFEFQDAKSYGLELFQEAIDAYKSGDKANAYYILGRVAHLIQDMTVPAHTNLDPHWPDSDDYESFINEHYQMWQADGLTLLNITSLADLFDYTAKISHGFPYGPEYHYWIFEEDTLTDEECIEQGNVLMPLAFRATATLFYIFYSAINAY